MILIWLLLFLHQTYADCPFNCTCYLDVRGRNAVTCRDGGIVGPLNLQGISTDTEVLRITAPDDNLNSLTLGPVFSSYKRLEEVHITRSNIPQLGKHFFWGLTKLEILNFSQNNITQILAYNFRGLISLKELYLDDNRIFSLPSETFRYLPKLKLLSIQRNRINELTPSIFLEVGRLHVLKISGNNLRELNADVFKDCKDLRVLECKGCALERLDNKIFTVLPRLIHVDLGDNRFKHLAADNLKNLTNVRHLKLDGNRLTAIKGKTFIHQEEVQSISLARNEISRIYPAAFHNLHNLTKLDLGYNKLESLQATVLEPVANTLRVLILSGNNLKVSSVRELVAQLDLDELHLAECGIFDIEDRFPESLQLLNLGGNHLSGLHVEVLPNGLRELDLSGNNFRGFDDYLLNKIDSISVVKLERNPWSCDFCHITPLLDRVNKSVTYQNIICVYPYTAAGKRLGTLERNQLTWCTGPSYSSGDANFFLLGDSSSIGIVAASMSLALILLAISAILGAFCYSRRHAAKYYTHEDKLAPDGDSVFGNHSPLFCEERELSFKFPLDDCIEDKKVCIATIDEIKKEHSIGNNT